jgi:diguanylate cyclase (GGDEF)-like protein
VRTASVEVGAGGGTLLVARVGARPFGAQELTLLGAMARVLAVTARLLGGLEDERRRGAENRRQLAGLQARERLLEEISRIQRSISEQARVEETFEAIADAAVAVLGSELVALRLLDPNDPSFTTVVAARGLPASVRRARRRAPVGEGVAGRAIAEGRLAVADGEDDLGIGTFGLSDARVGMAAPVRESGAIVGSLAVGSSDERIYGDDDGELLQRLAEHAGIALAAAKAAEAARQTFTDTLTGLANRTLFLDRLEHALARAERSGSDVTVLLVDLDGFKLVNDSLGHIAGDRLLAQAAERVRGCLRRSDTAARLGGDEFGVLLSESRGHARPRHVAERILAALAQPFDVQGRELAITASIGIASGSAEAEDLLRNADVAMERAKAEAGASLAVFEPGMHTAMVEALELRGDLHRALERGEIGLEFQPIVDFDGNRLCGVEALARWRHPTRGNVPPADFIPLAEETGLIGAIGAHVLREACGQLRRWREAFPHKADIRISVNLSAHQLHDGLAGEVAAVLAETGLEPADLVLEITETELMLDTDATLGHLADLKALGVRLAIDDFGTGYSSLRYLRRFPVDILKIAKPFVDGIDRDGDERALARTIIDLAAALHLATIAEGIEEPGQLERLRELGCEQGQGYLFARPLPPEGVDKLLASEPSAAAA